MDFGDRDLETAVARLEEAIATGDPSATAYEFGELRGTTGVGITESLDDLSKAYRSAAGIDAPRIVVGSFVDGWAEGTTGALLTRGAVDERTGLATPGYLATRLRDLARLGSASTMRLVLADASEAGGSSLRAALREARVGRALVESFPDGETPFGTGMSRVGVLAPFDEGFAAHLAHARIVIGRIVVGAGGELTVHETPESADAVGAFLRSL